MDHFILLYVFVVNKTSIPIYLFLTSVAPFYQVVNLLLWGASLVFLFFNSSLVITSIHARYYLTFCAYGSSLLSFLLGVPSICVSCLDYIFTLNSMHSVITSLFPAYMRSLFSVILQVSSVPVTARLLFGFLFQERAITSF